MFSTILKEVTGYFDRHALISAFFPSLVFWGVTLCLVTSQSVSWKVALEFWEKLPTTGQFLSLMSFFIWVSFWAFITINFQAALLRLYEGYWPDNTSLLGRLWQNRSRIYERRWDELKNTDRNLEQLQRKCIKNQRAIQILEDKIPSLVQSPPSPPTNLAIARETIEQNINAFILPENASEISPIEASEKIEILDEYWQNWAAAKPLLQTEIQDKQWQKFEQSLTKLTFALKKKVNHQRGVIEEQRHQLNRNQFLFLPLHRDDILPTQLGNIIKAAEQYSQERYNLDAVLIWSRLQTFLPESFARILQSAKTSLDLMVTLSAYCLIFGIPLSTWLSLHADSWFLSVVPLGFSVLAFLMQQWWIGVVAIIASGFGEVLSRWPQAQLLPLIRLQVLLTLVSAILWVSRLSYQNALQAALTYGEQLKTAFDLYRWKALEALNIKLPANLTEERMLWDEVCKMLYRGYQDQLNLYQYQTPDSTTLLKRPTETTEVIVAAQTLKAFSPINPTKLKFLTLPAKDVPQDAWTSMTGIEQCCPVSPIAPNSPICTHRLIQFSMLNQRFIVGIPATPAMAMGGDLQTGDRIKILLQKTNHAPEIIDDVLVLSIKSNDTGPIQREAAETYTYTLVLAVPEGSQNIWYTGRNHRLNILK